MSCDSTGDISSGFAGLMGRVQPLVMSGLTRMCLHFGIAEVGVQQIRIIV